MSSKIECKSRTLFGTHRNAYAHNIASSLVFYSACIENAHVEIDYNTRTLFGRHITHMSSEIGYKSRALFGTHTKRTC